MKNDSGSSTDIELPDLAATESSDAAIASRLEAIFREKFSQEGPLLPETRLLADLHFDSLQLFELVVALEESFALSIPSERLNQVNTFGDVIQLVSKLKQETSS